MGTTTQQTHQPGRAQHDTEGPMRSYGEVVRVIAADAGALYHRVADITRTPEWSLETRRCEWVDGAVAAQVGARFRGHNRWRLMRWERVCEVVVADPGREFAFRTVPRGDREDSTIWRFRFEPVAAGTRVTHSYEVVLPLRAAIERVALAVLPHHRDRRPDMAESLERIAAAAEGRAAVPQVRLGQAYTAEGPLDLSAMFVMHHAFRRDLRDFTAVIPATPVAEGDAWAALARRWAGFATSLHHHHRVEDLFIWPPLLSQVDAAGDAEGQATLEAMEAEHELIDPLLAACGEGFDAMATAATSDLRDRLARDLARTRKVLHDHLAHEEIDALPLVQRHLSVATWQDSESSARKEFGLGDLSFSVPWAAQELTREQFSIAFAHGGSVIRALLAVTRRRFEREQRIAFRHLPAR